jgi:hypothetical protein
VGADVGVRVLELRERRAVGLLGVVDDGVADVEPVGRPVGEVVVAIVGGIGAVLRVRRREELAVEPARALGSGRLRAVQVRDVRGAVLGVSAGLARGRRGAYM